LGNLLSRNDISTSSNSSISFDRHLIRREVAASIRDDAISFEKRLQLLRQGSLRVYTAVNVFFGLGDILPLVILRNLSIEHVWSAHVDFRRLVLVIHIQLGLFNISFELTPDLLVNRFASHEVR